MSELPVRERPDERTHVDYLRKLHQQLVQKDNIIKLLQEQLDSHHEIPGESDSVDRLTAALAEVEDKLALVESEADDLKGELAATREELHDARAQVAELEPVARRVTRLEAAASLKEEEVARYRELLREAEGENRTLEKARAEIAQLEEKLAVAATTRTRLERDLGRARERGARGQGDGREVRELREQVADLEASLEVARRAMEAAAVEVPGGEAGPDRFPLQQGVIEALQVFDDLRGELVGEEEALDTLEVRLGALREHLGLTRIETVGCAYDPELHVLGRVLYTEDGEHNTVLAEEVAGYRVAERVLKLAQVSVIRSPFECADCDAVGVRGAAFCHVCGSRILVRETSDEARVQRPRNEARKLLDIARSYHRRGDLPAAEEKLEAALSLAPEDPKVLFESALLAEECGRFDRAVTFLGRLPERVEGIQDLAAMRRRLAGKNEIWKTLKGL